MTDVVCVNCGESCPFIFKQFGSDVIKLNTCEACGELVDPYVEAELSVVVIDMLLLRKSVLRHVIFNSNLQGIWKLIVLFILCDAYQKTSQKVSSEKPFKHMTVINEIEFYFYLMCFKAFLEYFIFSSLVVIVLYYSRMVNVKRFSIKHLFHSIILASYGKLFMLPMIVWSRSDKYCEILISTFVFLSQVQVICVTTKLSNAVIAAVPVVVFEIGYLVIKNML
ncbi:protein ARV1-like [Uloborus diversus]|uniref:protein ARV1-like n=1 Tax=Uloborus diversus TaxID=327109 RepID=UPI002409CD17|nr:protein ARV1-like [Uloborus diversus]